MLKRLKMLCMGFLLFMATPMQAGDINDQELQCLAVMTFLESRGETTEGQVAAMLVAKQRMVESFLGATSICEVFYASGQYEPVIGHENATDPLSKSLQKIAGITSGDILETRAWEEIQKLAKQFLEGNERLIAPVEKRIANANYFITQRRCRQASSNHWCRTFKRKAIIGSHIFLRGTVL